MKTDFNLPIEKLTREDLTDIKVICFDGDGVTKPKGTEFLFENGQMVMDSFPPSPEMKKKLLALSEVFHVTISSGRNLQYLKNIYDEELMGKNGSLQAEIGMFLWWQGTKYQNFEISQKQQDKFEKIRQELAGIENPEIRGFEPKEYLITLHCRARVPEVEEIVSRNDPEQELFCWWNEEAYDVGIKGINKATGLEKLVGRLGYRMAQVLTVGNGINDENMTAAAGVDISTDPKHLKADFIAYGEEVGGSKVVDKILSLV